MKTLLLKALSICIFLVIASSNAISQPKNLSTFIPANIKMMINDGMEIDFIKMKENPREFLEAIFSYAKNNKHVNGKNIYAIQILTGLEQEWSNNLWNDKSREFMFYDANENQSEVVFEILESSAWVTEGRWLKYYNSNDRLIEWIWQSWENGNWVNDMKWNYIYDSNGNEVESSWSTWESGAWANFMMWIKSYDSNTNCVSELQKMWDSGAWTDMQRYTYIYDSGNRLIEIIGEMWMGAWMNNSKSIQSFDGINRVVSVLHQNWDIVGSAWIDDVKVNNTFNAAGLVVETIDEEWDGANWIFVSKRSSQYSGNLLTIFIWQNWESGAWINYLKTIYNYNASNYLKESINQDWVSGSWKNSTKWIYTWGQPTTDIENENLIADKFWLNQNYPNPFNPNTIIEFNIPNESYVTLEIFNSIGEKIKTIVSKKLAAGNYKESFDAGSFSTGIYFYKLSTDQFSSIKKMILLK